MRLKKPGVYYCERTVGPDEDIREFRAFIAAQGFGPWRANSAAHEDACGRIKQFFTLPGRLAFIEGFSCDYGYERTKNSANFYETDGLSANGFEQLVCFVRESL